MIEAIQQQLDLGQSYGTPTEAEFHMAEQITSMVDFVDQVRLVSSGTEACMSCLRLARGFREVEVYQVCWKLSWPC